MEQLVWMTDQARKNPESGKSVGGMVCIAMRCCSKIIVWGISWPGDIPPASYRHRPNIISRLISTETVRRLPY